MPRRLPAQGNQVLNARRHRNGDQSPAPISTESWQNVIGFSRTGSEGTPRGDRVWQTAPHNVGLSHVSSRSWMASLLPMPLGA